MQQHKNPDYILVDDRRFEEHICQKIIDYFESHSDQWKEGGYDGKVDKTKKDFTELYMDMRTMHQDEKDRFPTGLMQLQKTFEKYKEEHPFTTKIHPWGPNAIFKIQRYLPGQGYHEIHCENDVPLNHPCSARMMGWMVYLNDVYDGGHTQWPAQGKRIPPRRGDVVMWPAYWTHPHKGEVAENEVKYIMTGWFVFMGDHKNVKSK